MRSLHLCWRNLSATSTGNYCLINLTSFNCNAFEINAKDALMNHFAQNAFPTLPTSVSWLWSVDHAATYFLLRRLDIFVFRLKLCIWLRYNFGVVYHEKVPLNSERKMALWAFYKMFKAFLRRWSFQVRTGDNYSAPQSILSGLQKDLSCALFCFAFTLTMFPIKLLSSLLTISKFIAHCMMMMIPPMTSTFCKSILMRFPNDRNYGS